MIVNKSFAVWAAILLLTTSGLFGQPPQGSSQEEQEAELKKRVIASLRISAGATVADVGSGDGFYTIPIAHFVGPSGKVFAVDIDDKELSKLKQRLIKEHLGNVQIVKGLPNNPRLPVESVEAAMIVNAYHEMPEHEAMLRQVRVALKHNGRLIIMERMASRYETLSRREQADKHCLGPQFVKRELEGAGFAITKLDDPFVELPDDPEDGKQRWWLVVATKTSQ